jgi:hypothetical protein
LGLKTPSKTESINSHSRPEVKTREEPAELEEIKEEDLEGMRIRLKELRVEAEMKP